MGADDPLVLLNGYAATKDDWDPGFLEALGEFASVVRPELPVAGTVEEMAAGVLEAMDGEGVAAAPVVGWSMGGFVAQALAARSPDRVEALVLISTDGGGPGAVRSPEEVWSRLTDHGGTPREQATRLIGLLFPPALAPGIDAQFGEVVAEARAKLSEETLAAQEAAMDRWHAEPSAARAAVIECPVLVAAGSEDAVIPPANLELLAAAFPGAWTARFAGGGHAFMAQEPKRLAALIGAFLGR